jgi:tetratricopeptide (TPR) repeat protein
VKIFYIKQEAKYRNQICPKAVLNSDLFSKQNTTHQMDVIFVVPLVVFLLVLQYYRTDHDTPADKDRKRYAEGIALFEAGNYAVAFTYFNQAVKENRKSAIAYTYRGKCHLMDEKLHSALYDFTQALSFDTTLSEVHLEKGKVLYQLEEFNDAFLSFDKAVWFSRGKNADALHWRSIVHEISGH